MNKNILIPLLVVIVLLLGVGLFALNKTKKADIKIDKTVSPSNDIAQVFNKNKSKKCTWSENESGSSGVIYISGDKFKSQVTTNDLVSGETLTMYSVSDGDWIYSWTSKDKMGTKMKISEMTGREKEMMDDSQQNDENTDEVAMSQELLDKMNPGVDYKCTDWKVDKSMFVVPKDIQFQDTAKMLENAQENVVGNMSDYCNTLPDQASKNECLESLSKMNSFGQ